MKFLQNLFKKFKKTEVAKPARHATTPTPGSELVNFGITGMGQAYLEAIDGSKYILSVSKNSLGDPVLHLTLHTTDTY